MSTQPPAKQTQPRKHHGPNFRLWYCRNLPADIFHGSIIKFGKMIALAVGDIEDPSRLPARDSSVPRPMAIRGDNGGSVAKQVMNGRSGKYTPGSQVLKGGSSAKAEYMSQFMYRD